MFQIIQNRKYWYIVSLIIIFPGIVAIITGGLNLGIDFNGGSLIRVGYSDTRPNAQEVRQALEASGIGEIQVQPLGENEMTLRVKHIDNTKYQELIADLRVAFGDVEEQSFESIGPTIGQELREKAIYAILLVLLFIIIYISFAFRKISGGYVKSWVYGLGALVALFHDIIIVVGVFAILGKFFNVEINTLFITALLTVLGFSVHDTIVVYDRVREQLKNTTKTNFEEVVNVSVNQTLIRSVNTSLTTLLVLLALYIFGGESIQYFILALIIGIVAGTYSSVFIASPFLVTWYKFQGKRFGR